MYIIFGHFWPLGMSDAGSLLRGVVVLGLWAAVSLRCAGPLSWIASEVSEGVSPIPKGPRYQNIGCLGFLYEESYL